MNKSEQKLHRDATVLRLVATEGVCESDARMLVEVIGVDWASLKRESDFLKRDALPKRLGS